MYLSKANIKRRVLELIGGLWANFKTNPLYVVLLAVALLIGVNYYQQHRDRIAVEEQTARLQQYDQNLKQNAEQNRALQDFINQQNGVTQNLIGALKAIDKTVTALTESDLRQDKKLIEYSEELQNVRNPNLPTKQNNAVRAARRALPVSERERRALSTDSELYSEPAAGNGRAAPDKAN